MLEEQLAQASPDLLRELLQTFVNTLLSAEADVVCGAALRGRSLDVPLSSVSHPSLTRRTWFAPRRHVLVETTDGERARFLINGARNVIATLAEAVRETGTEPVVSD